MEGDGEHQWAQRGPAAWPGDGSGIQLMSGAEVSFYLFKLVRRGLLPLLLTESLEHILWIFVTRA